MTTGNLSLILGMSVVGMAVAGWVFILFLMKKKILEDSRIDKLISLGQWVIASVAIVITGYIVSDSFKEREQQIKELEFYDKYVTTVIQAEGVEQRWRLCQYFAAVSPKGEFKAAWKAYGAEIQKDYDAYLLTKKQIDSIENKGFLANPNEISKLKSLRQKLDQQEQSLVPKKGNTRSANPTVFIQILNEMQRDNAQDLVNKITGLGYQVPGIELIREPVNLKKNEIRFFRPADEIYALNVQELLKEMNIESILKIIPAYASKAKEGTIEVWLK